MALGFGGDWDNGPSHAEVAALEAEILRLKRESESLRTNATALIGAADARVRHLESQVQQLQAAATAAVNERRANDLTIQVADFHNAFGFPVRFKITEPSADEVALRLRLITEEFLEFLEAHGAPGLIRSEIWERVTKWVEWQRGGPGFRVDLVGAADAMADLDYVIEGTRLTYGIPRQTVANEVQSSNLAKAGGELNPETGKLGKPDGWMGPDIEGILRRHGL